MYVVSVVWSLAPACQHMQKNLGWRYWLVHGDCGTHKSVSAVLIRHSTPSNEVWLVRFLCVASVWTLDYSSALGLIEFRCWNTKTAICLILLHTWTISLFMRWPLDSCLMTPVTLRQTPRESLSLPEQPFTEGVWMTEKGVKWRIREGKGIKERW